MCPLVLQPCMHAGSSSFGSSMLVQYMPISVSDAPSSFHLPLCLPRSSLMHNAVLQTIATAAAANSTVATSIMHTLYTSTTHLISGLNAGIFTSAYIASVNYALVS